LRWLRCRIDVACGWLRPAILHSAFFILHSAFAAALAKEKKAELVTGDPEFRALEKEILVVWLK